MPTLTALHERTLKINHLDYETSRFNYNILNLNKRKLEKKTFGPTIPNILSVIVFSSKGCANVYKYLLNPNEDINSKIQLKWSRDLSEEIPLSSIENSLKILRTIPVSVYFKYSRSKLMHSRIKPGIGFPRNYQP